MESFMTREAWPDTCTVRCRYMHTCQYLCMCCSHFCAFQVSLEDSFASVKEWACADRALSKYKSPNYLCNIRKFPFILLAWRMCDWSDKQIKLLIYKYTSDICVPGKALVCFLVFQTSPVWVHLCVVRFLPDEIRVSSRVRDRPLFA